MNSLFEYNGKIIDANGNVVDMNKESNMYLEIDRLSDGLEYVAESQIVLVENWCLHKINCLKIVTQHHDVYTDNANVKWVNREEMLRELKERGSVPGCKEK